MWRDKWFVAMRDPQKGGLHISRVSTEFQKNLLDEINNNCLELIAKDLENPCICVYKFFSGEFMVAVAKKISGSYKESRKHEIIRGVILTETELIPFCQSFMTYDFMTEIFFPDDTDYDNPGEWEVPQIERENQDLVPESLKQMDMEEILGLYNALKRIKKKKMKIQLLVKQGEELQMLAVLSCVGKIAGVRLFIVANGECTQRSPDILILDKIAYQSTREYRKVTLEEFISMGNECENEYDEEIHDEQQINKTVRFCLNYITKRDISDYELYEFLEDFKEKEADLYLKFLRELTKKMFEFPNIECYNRRYMKLLYIIYRKKDEEKVSDSVEIQTAPYDFGKIYCFLRKKAKTKRELKKLLVMMMEVQFEECVGQFDERAIHEAANNSVKLL